MFCRRVRTTYFGTLSQGAADAILTEALGPTGPDQPGLIEPTGGPMPPLDVSPAARAVVRSVPPQAAPPDSSTWPLWALGAILIYGGLYWAARTAK